MALLEQRAPARSPSAARARSAWNLAASLQGSGRESGSGSGRDPAAVVVPVSGSVRILGEPWGQHFRMGSCRLALPRWHSST